VDTTFSTNSTNQPAVSPASQAQVGQASGPSQAERAKLLQLAQEFESHFLVQMLRQMREAMTDDEQKDGLGAGTMTDTIDIELARQLTRAGGGIGLTRTLQNTLERQVLGTTGEVAVARPPLVSLAEPHDADAAVPLPLSAPVSSSFGYRADPFSGARRFHAGVDIAAAYGREVPSAGAGEVVFSGSQGGYGNTVVVEHANGIRTRYAHLSSIQVEVGASVDAGTVVGRVGSSGRSTGPHLHFEVLQDGRPVNPAVAATRFAGLLKLQGVVADLPSSQPSVLGVAVGVDDEDSGQ
jgi:murein DD-endopeptidase MepM/ murein hydrolase activator NlpD